MEALLRDQSSRVESRLVSPNPARPQSPLVAEPLRADRSAALEARPKSMSAANFDIGQCEVGETYDVPLSLIDTNSRGVRHFYRDTEVYRIGESMKSDGQDVAANGFIKDGRIELYDGGTRYRGAPVAGSQTLRVRIDKPPADAKEQFKRSVALNDLRSQHTALDLAVSFAKLLQDGIYKTQDELASEMTDRKGNPMTKSLVNMYLRIAKIPTRYLQSMSMHESTSSFAVAYEISAVFSRDDYEGNEEQYNPIAVDIIQEVQAKSLTKEATRSLVSSRLEGPRQRQRAETTNLKLGDKKGVLKVFRGSRGQLDLSIKGLEEKQLDSLREQIEQVFATFGGARQSIS